MQYLAHCQKGSSSTHISSDLLEYIMHCVLIVVVYSSNNIRLVCQTLIWEVGINYFMTKCLHNSAIWRQVHNAYFSNLHCTIHRIMYFCQSGSRSKSCLINLQLIFMGVCTIIRLPYAFQSFSSSTSVWK